MTSSRDTVSAADIPDLVHSGCGTFLVAEDEPALRIFMATLLTNSGYRVILADDGQDAVDRYILHKDEIDLVILDMVMPAKAD